MRFGILEVGRVNDALVAKHGDYPMQFQRMFQAIDPTLELAVIPVLDGAMPDSVHDCDAWVVIGSKHGVYDPLPWIDPVKAFLREARAAGVPLIGVCFGHQLMAEAFGGRAEKFPGGWACGVHQYDVLARPAWMADSPGALAFHAMHQDQVTALPEDATCLAESAFCRYAAIAYGDPDTPDAISIQPHPEFEADYAQDLVDLRSGVAIPDDVAGAARATFGDPVDNLAFARWAVAYVRQAAARRQAA